MKTRKSISKRFKITKRGKVQRKLIGQNHLRSKKTGSKKRKSRKWVRVSASEAKKIKRIIHG